MGEYNSKDRYVVNGSSAVKVQEKEIQSKPQKKPVDGRQMQVYHRSMVDVISVSSVFLTLAACVCILGFSFSYIHTKTELTTLSSSVSGLQRELESVREDNQALRNQVSAASDIETIRKKAVNELHMKPASDSQIIYYHQSDSEYVTQKDDIPNE